MPARSSTYPVRVPTDRPMLHAPLDEDTLDAWRTFATQHGVTMAALAEAIGRAWQLDGTPPAWQLDLAAVARQVAAERRDRRPID